MSLAGLGYLKLRAANTRRSQEWALKRTILSGRSVACTSAHANCSAAGADCVAGWKIDAKPSSAKLVRQPVDDHPVFLIGRPDIPQPGAYVHFHWTGMAMPMPYLSVPGYLLQLTAFNRFCFIHHGAEIATAAMSCRDNGGVKVEPGVDTATHLNIVTNDPSGM